ncbi:MAG: FkbM family methyltransferase [Dehalococcoidia bacterium]
MIRKGLKYLKQEGLVNFCRRVIIFLVIETWASIMVRIKFLGKPKDIVMGIQGSLMRLNIDDKGVARELALEGIRERLCTETIQKQLRNGDCVLDIGANIGYYCLMESRLVGKTGKVYAIEPVPYNMNRLRENIELNGYSNVETFQIAIGERDGKASLYLSDHPNWCSFYPPRVVKGEVEVDVLSLDSFTENKRMPDMIRMDVEGFEYEILEGMPGILGSGAPLKYFVEFHPDMMGRERAIQFLEILKRHGFVLKRVVIEPHTYPPFSRWALAFVDYLNQKKLKMKFGAYEMSIDELLANKPLMDGWAGHPGLFLERKANTKD